MKQFIYTVTYGKTGRNGGRPVEVTVWRIQNNQAKRLGTQEHNTASWYGDLAVAKQIISEHTGLPMKDSYDLVSNDCNIEQLR